MVESDEVVHAFMAAGRIVLLLRGALLWLSPLHSPAPEGAAGVEKLNHQCVLQGRGAVCLQQRFAQARTVVEVR